MTGEIKVKIAQGNSKDPRYDYYPYWKLTVIDEDSGKQVDITPTYEQIKKMITQFLLHELYVDISPRKRKSQFRKDKADLIKNIRDIQPKLTDYDVPKIYKEYKKIGYEEYFEELEFEKDSSNEDDK